ncbi:sigma-54-dependent Fis family transcriptional regulator [Vibrio sonorensis]|uniref:sigma-54-dependent Fis family transcriptional regulator n=1 Tax=Vibrio sonorensis TaxID=1004316 RepID=UPI0008DA785C|nr:sigma-54-dependent Fis family transcriptional regulator [Vibrio sonorensis]
MDLRTQSHSDWLATSWLRSSDAGLRERSLPDHHPIAPSALKQRQTDKKLVIEAVELCALPLFNQMFAHTDSRLILSDGEGVIVASWGQERFGEKLTSIALSAGACWQEKLKGTNAIGTAIIEKKPVTVVGEQHYIRQHRFISCSASPLFDHHGHLVGVLDITSEQSQHDVSTQVLVQNMVQLVENYLLSSVPQGVLRIDLSLDKETIASGWQGIVIADANGQILAHNRVASHLLRSSKLLGYQLESVLDYDHQLHIAKHHLESKPKRSRVVSASCELHHGDHRIEAAWQQANKVIGKEVPLLILGETGVGKSQFVKALHKNNLCGHAPLVTVNCGALPKDLIESELFGYVGGAFTGANPKGYEGRIRQANKGMLFLDEIGEMPSSAQCRLLHVLQDKEVVPVGSSSPIKVDIQIVAATHQDLALLVEKGDFRQDLFYRLNGLALEMPPLRDRHDKTDLIHAIHRQYTKSQCLSDELLQLFDSYHWPGNIRELDNLIKVASLIAGDEEELNIGHVPSGLNKALLDVKNGVSKGCQLKETVDETLLSTFNANAQNVSKTARVLGISRNTIYRKLRALGVLR